MELFGELEAERIRWITIRCPCGPRRATTSLRNTIDRQRQQDSAWSDFQLRAMFMRATTGSEVSGFAHLGDAADGRFEEILSGSNRLFGVEIEQFAPNRSATEQIRRLGLRWVEAGPSIQVESFRSLMLSIGPKHAKRTRHSPSLPPEPPGNEPLPIIIADYGNPWMGANWL